MEDCKNICVNTSRTCEWYVVENKDADKQNRNCQKNTYTHNIGLMKIKTYSGFFLPWYQTRYNTGLLFPNWKKTANSLISELPTSNQSRGRTSQSPDKPIKNKETNTTRKTTTHRVHVPSPLLLPSTPSFFTAYHLHQSIHHSHSVTRCQSTRSESTSSILFDQTRHTREWLCASMLCLHILKILWYYCVSSLWFEWLTLLWRINFVFFPP